MPRRYTPEKREIELDLRYNSQLVTMFINRLMRDGKKSTAESVLTTRSTLLRSAPSDWPSRSSSRRWTMPARVEVRPRRGGSTHQVPVEVPGRDEPGDALAADGCAQPWGRSMSDKLASELMDAANGQGAAVSARMTPTVWPKRTVRSRTTASNWFRDSRWPFH